VTFHSGLAAESANVFGVLGDFHLLDLFSEGGTVSCTVLSGNTDLLSSLRHLGCGCCDERCLEMYGMAFALVSGIGLSRTRLRASTVVPFRFSMRAE